MKRIALSLAFEDEELAEPVAPERIIQVIPAPPDVQSPQDLWRYRTPEGQLSIEPSAPLCPAAPEGAVLTQAVGVDIDEPPREGWYLRFNKGKVSVAGGAFPITLPLPPVTLMEIRDVHDVERPNMDRRAGDVASDEAPGAAEGISSTRGTTTATRFTTSHKIGTITVTDEYEYDSAIRLVQRTTDTSAGTSVFRPTPQITVVALGDFGNDWSEGGADRESSTAMVIEGEITTQEAVDACGELVDTLRFENDEQTVNLATQEVSGTSETPNVYNIAPHRNGLIVREQKRFTQVVTVDGLKLVIEWDYVSVLGNFEPYPTRDAALEALRS